MDILFIVSKAVPFAKTTRLAGVAGLLPNVLAASERVSLVIPEHIKTYKTVLVEDINHG